MSSARLCIKDERCGFCSGPSLTTQPLHYCTVLALTSFLGRERRGETTGRQTKGPITYFCQLTSSASPHTPRSAWIPGRDLFASPPRPKSNHKQRTIRTVFHCKQNILPAGSDTVSRSSPRVQPLLLLSRSTGQLVMRNSIVSLHQQKITSCYPYDWPSLLPPSFVIHPHSLDHSQINFLQSSTCIPCTARITIQSPPQEHRARLATGYETD
jgi:hypothetical protein